MKNCKQCEEQLWEAAETGDIPAALADHLAACPDCREALSLLQAVMCGFQALRCLPERIPAVHVAPAPIFAWRRALAVAAVVLLVVLAAWAFSGMRHAGSGPHAVSAPIVIKRQDTATHAPQVRRVLTPPGIPAHRHIDARRAHQGRNGARRHPRAHPAGHPSATVVASAPVPIPDNLKPLSALPVYNLAALTDSPSETGGMF